jgi:hypothetical protein
MAEKSIDEQIADLNKQIKDLEQKRFDLEHPKQEYPKFVMDPRNSSRGRIVNNKEEEDKALKGGGEDVPTFEKTAYELERDSRDLGESEHDDAEAAGAHGTARVRKANAVRATADKADTAAKGTDDKTRYKQDSGGPKAPRSDKTVRVKAASKTSKAKKVKVR